VSRTVAILGATGQVGRTTLAVLEERAFPLDRLRLLASPGSRSGRTVRFRGAEVPVEPVTAEAFRGVDIALFAVKNPIALEWSGPAQAAGAVVIDNSSAYRYDDRVPLVVPEVNGELLDARPTLVANPNCSAAPIVVALAALRPAGALKKLVVSTYQSVSGAGTAALAELERGVRAGLEGAVPPREDGGAPFAFNCVPQIDRFEDNGYTREEMKVVWETRKILGLPGLPVTVTAVRVPVRIGHGASVHAYFDRPVTPDAARELWRAFPGLEVADDPAHMVYPTSLAVAGRDPVIVGRARVDLMEPNGLAFYLVSDNLRKGAALNAVQIAERWIQAPAGTR
jgi:aspartate-semialdehyde dehydrogenase